jgi:amidase
MEELSILELQRRMASSETTARSLAEHYIERIQQLDKHGPTLKAVIELNPSALSIAVALDEERRTRGPRSPLHGVPIMLKDNIDTADNMMTTAGSVALSGSKPRHDAFVAEKLREAGAVILGKTNLSEWANFRSSRSSSGWSSRGGQTRNPYVLDRNPSGSSSGSGVAVSANLCAAAIGTETDGSITSPAAANGVIGLKPTVGLVSRSGIIPIAHSQDTAGPMARCVTDAAILLGALTDVDPRDAATERSSTEGLSDYTPYLVANGLRGARIGVARNFFGFHERVDAIIEGALEAMRQEGAEIIDTDLATSDAYSESEYEVLLYEFKHGLNAYLKELGPEAPLQSLADVIAFNEQNKAKVMPYFGQEHLLKAQAKGPLSERAYRKALEHNHRLTRDEGIDATIKRHRLDAIVAPTNGPAWTTDLINGDHSLGGSSSPAAVAGYPNITVPAGFVNGLPVGISFFSTAFQEPTLIACFRFEQATMVRQAPKFLASVVS